MTQVTSTTDSVYVTALGTQPLIAATRGEGGNGDAAYSDDYLSITTGMLALGQSWRVCHLPFDSVIKGVKIMTDGVLDSNATQTLVLDFNIIFSDSAFDMTPASLQALIPTSANTGATTSVSAYSSPNLMFGSITLSGNNAQFPPKINGANQWLDITANGSGGLFYNSLPLMQTRLWRLLGFKDGQGNYFNPGGYVNLNVNVSTAAATAHAAKMFFHIDYET